MRERKGTKMNILRSVSIGVISGAVTFLAANRTTVGPDAELRLTDAIQKLTAESQQLARSIEELSNAVVVGAIPSSNVHDDRRVLETSTVQDLERRVRSTAMYAAQIELALQGIDKAMSTLPMIQKRS